MQTTSPRKKKRSQRKILLVILIFWAALYVVDSPAPPVALPEGPVTAYLLDGNAHVFTNDPTPKLHRWPIIEEKTIDDPELLNEIRSKIGSRFSYSIFLPTLCFDPHIGFRFGSGDKAVDVLICLECDNADFFYGRDLNELVISWPGHSRFKDLHEHVFPNSQPKIEKFHAEFVARQEARRSATTAPTAGKRAG